eukprot:maker-scaffold_6-snap-gene-16.20-mRNA-1 protein AED:0.00 eAED:0.00 QI:84/1/1/1/1/1/2/252/250
MLRFFFTRHAEREDYVNYHWEETADRPFDPPISNRGRRQAEKCGRFLSRKIKEGDETKCFASPFLRCIQTSKGILTNITTTGFTLPVLHLEDGVSEHNYFLRDHLLYAQPSIESIFLSGNDLRTEAYPLEVSPRRKMLYQIKFNQRYEEVNEKGQLVRNSTRLRTFVRKFLEHLDKTWDRKNNLNCIVVGHDSSTQDLVRLMTNDKYDLGYVTYLNTFCIVPSPGQDVTTQSLIETSFDIEAVWKPSSRS